MQHILVKPKVKGVEEDEDLPDDIVYVVFSIYMYIMKEKTSINGFFSFFKYLFSITMCFSATKIS